MVLGNISIFQAGSLFPSVSGATLLQWGNKELGNIEIKEIKKRIVKVLNERSSINISTISEEFGFPPRKVISALKELEEEGIVREAK